MSNEKNRKLSTWGAFLKAYSIIMKTLEREMEEEWHLPLTWFDVLAWLSHAPKGRLRMQVLADSIYLSNSGLTRLLDRMTDAGLVERQNCSNDRRGWYAVITTKGREAFNQTLPGHKQVVNKYFLSRFNEDEIEVLHSLLSRLAAPPGHIKKKTQSEGKAL